MSPPQVQELAAPVAAAPAAAGAGPGLPFWKTLVLALCAMQLGPSLATITGYQLHWSGASAWTALACAALICCGVAVAISYVAHRHTGTAAILSYVQGVLPYWAVCIVGATLLLGYILGPSTMTMWAAAYLSSILLQFGFGWAASPLAISVWVVAIAALAGYCAYRGLELSARVSLALGIISFPAALAVTIAAAAAKGGLHIDYAQALHELSWPALARGTFIALGSFVGFDGVCALASESSDPVRNASKLLGWTVILMGLTNVLGALLQTPTLLAHTAALDAGQTPTFALMQASGLAPAYVLVDATLYFAELAGIIAWLNLSALIIAGAARGGFLPRSLGVVHARTGAPYRAVFLIAALSAIIPAALQVLGGSTVLVSMTYVTNILVLFWIVAYVLVCVAAIVLHHRNAQRPGITYCIAVLSIVAIGIILVLQDLEPVDALYRATNYFALGLLIIASAALFLATRHRRGALQGLS